MTRPLALILGWLLAAYAVLRAARPRSRPGEIHTRVYISGREIARAVNRANR